MNARKHDGVTYNLGHNEQMQVSIALGAVHDWLRDGTDRLNKVDMQHVDPRTIGYLLNIFGSEGLVSVTKQVETEDEYDEPTLERRDGAYCCEQGECDGHPASGIQDSATRSLLGWQNGKGSDSEPPKPGTLAGLEWGRTLWWDYPRVVLVEQLHLSEEFAKTGDQAAADEVIVAKSILAERFGYNFGQCDKCGQRAPFHWSTCYEDHGLHPRFPDEFDAFARLADSIRSASVTGRHRANLPQTAPSSPPGSGLMGLLADVMREC